MIDTKNEILALLKTRELQLAKPREVLKDEKIKRYKDISRSKCEETYDYKVSDETCPLASTSSKPLGTEVPSKRDLASPTEEVSLLSRAANTSSRVFTGVSLQHSRTKKGVKVMVNLQTAEQARTGDITTLTAELKRWDRLRELKRNANDSEQFESMYLDTVETLKRMPPDQRRPYCMGRLHDRGSRSEWYPDIMMLGILDQDECLKYVLLNIEGEEYEVDMTGELSPRQKTAFHSTGLLGELKNNRPRPSLGTAPTRKL